MSYILISYSLYLAITIILKQIASAVDVHLDSGNLIRFMPQLLEQLPQWNRVGALVAPTVNYGLSYPHIGFTGLVHIRIPTFMALIEESRRSHRDSGGISLEDLRHELDLGTATRSRSSQGSKKAT